MQNEPSRPGWLVGSVPYRSLVTVPWLVTQQTLLVGIVHVVRGRRLDLTRWIVTHEAVIPSFQFMFDLGRQVHQERSRLDKTAGRMADVTFARQVIFGRFVAIAAHKLGRFGAFHVATSARGRCMGTLQRDGVRFRRQRRILEAGRRMAVLAIGPKVIAGWLVTVAAHKVGRFSAFHVATIARGRGMGALQRDGMRLRRQRRILEAGRRMAILAIGPKVIAGRLVAASAITGDLLAFHVAVGTLRRRVGSF